MRADITFFEKYPFLHTLSLQFLRQPYVDFSLEYFKIFEFMDVPYLKEWIWKQFDQLVKQSIVFPQKASLQYLNLIDLKSNRQDAGHSSVTNVKQENVEKHAQAIEIAKEKGEYEGLLFVKVVEAKKLREPEKSSSSLGHGLYCIISTTSDELFTTKAVRKSRAPIWNEFFELLILKNKKKKLELTVMARETGRGDELLGMCSVDNFDEIANTRANTAIWFPLEHMTKKGETCPAGEIHLQMRILQEHK